MPQVANENWYNAHNFYGDLEDLDAATLADVQSFFKQYYAPNNAVLVVVGDYNPAQTKAWIEKYFATIPSVQLAPKPDITEPRQTVEKRQSKEDRLAQRPALGLAYHMPPRNSPEYWAMGLIEQILVQGRDSRLFQELVQRRGFTGGVTGGINFGLGNMLNYDGPMLMITSLIHDADKPADSIIAAIDGVIEDLRTRPVDAATLERARTKARSGFYSYLEALGGFGRADLLAVFALFDSDPARINRLEDEFAKVTPELIQRTAQEYLRPTNRTILTIEPRKPTP
jgi:predicted Zn-dependent peptidase